MKTLFGHLFGKKAQALPDRLPPAAGSKPQTSNFEPYKKGDVIGAKYYVHGIIGAGGFGVVLLVSERGTDRLLALKTFRDEFLPDAATREAFKKEASLWVNIDEHPFILTARWIEVFSDRLFVMMDYVEPDPQGRVSLADHLHSKQPVPEMRVTEWAIQFCMGMEHATSHGVRCHRDIKPSNILIGREGNVRIADFGSAAMQHKLNERERLAAELCEEAGIELIVERSKEKERLFVSRAPDGSFGFSVIEMEGKVVSGTPGYIAPEVYRGATSDIQSDIYAFGLVLWQMSTGSATPPFVERVGDLRQMMQKTYENQASGRLPAVGHVLDAVVRQCLRANPAERYGDFAGLRKALEVIRGRASAQPLQRPTAEHESPAYWSTRGASFCSLGKFEEAIACFDRAIGIDPEYAHAWSNKGVVLYELGRNHDALKCFENALNLDSSDAMAWCNVANVLSTLGRHEEAIPCCKKALALDLHDPTTWNNKGNAHHALGAYEEAITCYDEALARDRRDSRASVQQRR